MINARVPGERIRMRDLAEQVIEHMSPSTARNYKTYIKLLVDGTDSRVADLLDLVGSTGDVPTMDRHIVETIQGTNVRESHPAMRVLGILRMSA